MAGFSIRAEYQLQGDQPQAVERLSQGLTAGDHFQTLLGVTGSGKTFTMANIIAKVGRPALVMAPNKTLAAQLCNEFREFLPENAVEYFVSYYDYYQPEAYLPASDTYIEKDSSINQEIDRLRHAATSSLLMRRDVVIVASVSCIYGLGSPEEYLGQVVLLKEGDEVSRDEVFAKRHERHPGEPCPPHDWVFFNPHDQAARARRFVKCFYQARKKAGLPKMTSHTLRHYFISQAMMSKDVNPYSISKFVGHSGTKMIEQVYGHLRSDYLQEQMGRVQIVGTNGNGGTPAVQPPAPSAPADDQDRGHLRVVGE